DQELAGFVLRGLKWFQRQLMLYHGLLAAEKPFTPAERKVVSLLLTHKSEKEIAAALGQSFHTTHQHVTKIFRGFGVNGRAAFMALWLSGR
ncbi:MAG TPA: LuxR C-terminal-related transcriptional regulator, partial [Verrucomicrobiae bacterium]